MSEEMNATVDKSKGIEPGRDESIDITSLLKAARETNEEETVEEEKSPLQKMKEEKESRPQGMVVDNKVLAEKNAPKEIKSKNESDAEEEVAAYMAEQDKLIEAAKKTVVTRPPSSPEEMVQLMDNLENVSINGDVGENVDNPNIRLLTDEEIESGVVEGGNATLDDSQFEETEEAEPENQLSEEDQQTIQVLIDKTGLGGDFAFTDEEREKIVNAKQIVLTEVEEVELKSIKVKKPVKSFVDSVKEYEFAGTKMPMIFPASRFKADMCGMTYGEMGDIIVTGDESITFEQMRKRFTVIYNKMKNPSCGEFEDFDDFLKKFSYLDMDLAMFGLVVATYPEVDEIALTCNNPRCRRGFNHRFRPASLLRFDKTNSKFINTMNEIVNAKPEDYQKIFNESPTNMHRRYVLPMSKFIVEIGVASAYEFLYTLVQNGVITDKFANEHPDDVNGILFANSSMLALIRSVYVPDGDEYVQYEDFEDMIRVLYMAKPEDIRIITTLLQKYTEAYAVTFELTNITCPHCGTKTERIPININELVFRKYQSLMSEEIDISNMSVL